MKYRFIREYACYVKRTILNDWVGVPYSVKETRTTAIDNTVANFNRGLITVDETINTIMSLGRYGVSV